MERPRANGNTFSVGFSGGNTFGNISNGKSYVLSADTSHNYALQETTSFGASMGIGASAGLVMTYTNATNVQDLTGASSSYGISIASIAGFSTDYITFVPASNPSATCWGISIVVSGGGSLEFHGAQNYTTGTSSWNPFAALRTLLYGG